jgi:hypothetical protein
MEPTYKLRLIKKAKKCAEVAKPVAVSALLMLAPHAVFECEKFFAFQEARCQDIGEASRHYAEMLTSTSTATDTVSYL